MEQTIKALWGVTDPLLSVTGLVEILEDEHGEKEGTLVPLEVGMHNKECLSDDVASSSWRLPIV